MKVLVGYTYSSRAAGYECTERIIMELEKLPQNEAEIEKLEEEVRHEFYCRRQSHDFTPHIVAVSVLG